MLLAPESGKSVHKQPWVAFTYDDDAARVEETCLCRSLPKYAKYKHDAGLALNAPLGKVTIYAPHTVNDEGDTGRTLNADVHWRTDAAKLDRVITDIDFNRSVIGPTFPQTGAGIHDSNQGALTGTTGKPAKNNHARRHRNSNPRECIFAEIFLYGRGRKVDVITVNDVILTIAKREIYFNFLIFLS